jgi:hypothetical protein
MCSSRRPCLEHDRNSQPRSIDGREGGGLHFAAVGNQKAPHVSRPSRFRAARACPAHGGCHPRRARAPADWTRAGRTHAPVLSVGRDGAATPHAQRCHLAAADPGRGPARRAARTPSTCPSSLGTIVRQHPMSSGVLSSPPTSGRGQPRTAARTPCTNSPAPQDSTPAGTAKGRPHAT